MCADNDSFSSPNAWSDFFVPVRHHPCDGILETFHSSTDHGGHDVAGRGMRYLEWAWDPDPTDTTYITDFAYLLRDDKGDVRCEYDRHVLGLFKSGDWLRVLTDVGFRAQIIQPEGGKRESATPVFLGIRQNL